MGKPGQPASARLAHALTGYIHISAVHAPPRKRIVGSFEKFEGLDVAALIERNWPALCALMDAGTTDEFAWRISDIYDQESGENCEQIGRASCRERVCQYGMISVVARSI